MRPCSRALMITRAPIYHAILEKCPYRTLTGIKILKRFRFMQCERDASAAILACSGAALALYY